MNRIYLFTTITFLLACILLPQGVLAGTEPPVLTLEQLAISFEKDPKNHHINYEYCGKLNEAKEHTKAVEVCTLAITTGNKDTLPWSYLNRGIAYKALGNIEAAKKDRAASKEHGMRNWLLVNFLPIEE